MSREYWIGKRVQIPAWSTQWMMGARYGEVVDAGPSNQMARILNAGVAGTQTALRIKLDRILWPVIFLADDCQEVD